MIKYCLFILLYGYVLIACSNQEVSRYSQKEDGYPTKKQNISQIGNAIPKDEPKSHYGNKSPYTVRNQTYYVLNSSKKFKQHGIASWYGTKFQGHRTSNGEIYDMYKMTAAHKTLPLPSYIKVTHLKNGKQVIVRVNDRGPFHDNRILDLSYVAAKKLGIEGVGEVLIEAIQTTETTQNRSPIYLQIGAYAHKENALNQKNKIKAWINKPITIEKTKKMIYRVKIGPILSKKQENKIKAQLDKQQIAYQITN